MDFITYLKLFCPTLFKSMGFKFSLLFDIHQSDINRSFLILIWQLFKPACLKFYNSVGYLCFELHILLQTAEMLSNKLLDIMVHIRID